MDAGPFGRPTILTISIWPGHHVTKRSQIDHFSVNKIPKTSELPRAPPPGPPPGALPMDPMPLDAPLASLTTLYSVNGLAPPLLKTFRGPC